MWVTSCWQMPPEPAARWSPRKPWRRCNGGTKTEKAVSEFMRSIFKKINVKSKTVTGGESIEVVYEVRVSSTNTGFVNDLLKFNGVSSAVMVSYDGNYTA